MGDGVWGDKVKSQAMTEVQKPLVIEPRYVAYVLDCCCFRAVNIESLASLAKHVKTNTYHMPLWDMQQRC